MTAIKFLRWTDNLAECNRYELEAGEPTAMAPEHNRHNLVKVEVLLASTTGVDSCDKLIGYFQLSSVEHYLLVDPVRYAVIHHYRTDEGIGTSLLQQDRLKIDPPALKSMSQSSLKLSRQASAERHLSDIVVVWWMGR